jgi:AcrR family transcriptional regulator
MAAVRTNGPEVSVEQIAAQAGVSKPVFYEEFGDKEGIAEAVAIEIAHGAETRFLEQVAAGSALDIATTVRAGVETLIGLVTDEPEIYRFIVRSMRASDRGLLDNGFVRALDSRVSTLISLLAPDADPVLLGALGHGLFGFVWATVESWRVTEEPPRDELINALVAVVTHGFDAVGRPNPTPS